MTNKTDPDAITNAAYQRGATDERARLLDEVTKAIMAVRNDAENWRILTDFGDDAYNAYREKVLDLACNAIARRVAAMRRSE